MTLNASETADISGCMVNGADVQGLASVSAVFCDSLEVLQAARERGLKSEARILTMSPALALSGLDNVEYLEARVPTDVMRWVHGSLNDFAAAVVSAARSEPCLAEHALLAGQTAMLINPWMLKAACLTENDFREPRAVLLVDEASPSYSASFSAPWQTLLAGAQKLLVERFPVTPTCERSARGESDVSFLNRLAVAGPDRALYRLLLAFWRAMPCGLGKGEIIVTKENELVKETAVQLGLRGYRLSEISVNRISAEQLNEEKRLTFRQVLEPILRKRFSRLLTPKAEENLTDIFFDRLFSAVGRQCSWKSFWSAKFSGQTCRRPSAILTNFPTAEVFEPLRSIAERERCLVAAFQHGVDREMAWAVDQKEIVLENVLSDVLFTYNEASRNVALRNRFATNCKNVAAVGMPRDYFRVGRSRIAAEAPPILFVSTLLYRSYNQLRFEERSDLDKARDEIQLIEEVLDRLPHRVGYKPYPALRFPDPDPVIAAALKAGSVEVLGGHVDLRYMLNRHRVLVSTRATSTIGWCVMSKRPFVFIDTGDYFRIQPNMRDAFIEGTFFFDATCPTWRSDLRHFLSRPLQDIEEEWRAKEEGHAKLVERCFTVPVPGAGQRAARMISDYIEPNLTARLPA
ncbi:hypothetical protein [Roseobacter sp. HKCCD7870]|uniref:hypothetical protein n=1 Tax=Roseobacter sp. HKCCD7870 TaxID=3120343 RepID=UPI0030EE02BA